MPVLFIEPSRRLSAATLLSRDFRRRYFFADRWSVSKVPSLNGS
jgi:hypothetical protein